MKKVITIIVFSCLVLACGRVTVHKALDKASSLLTERSDSSLAVLQSIRIDDIQSRKDRARYAIIKSAAYDKNYIDLCSDSLISFAVDYYSERRGNDRQRMLAWYYDGIVKKNAGEYERAVVSFEKAERIAEKAGDDYHVGLVNQNKAVVFNARNNIIEAITFAKKAIDAFDRAGKPLYSIYSKLTLARLYTTNKDYSLAENVLDSIEPDSPDEYFLNSCRILRANGLAADNRNLGKAVEIFRSVPEQLYHITDYGRLAIAYERLGQKDSSDLMMDCAYRNCRNDLDTATVDFMASRIASERRDYEKACRLAMNAALVQDSLTRILLSQSINNALRDYYREDASRQELHARQEHKNAVSTIVIILLVFSLVFVVMDSRNRKNKEQIKDQITQITLQREELSKAIKNNALLVSSVFNEKYFHLEQISADYYASTDPREKERLLKMFKEQTDKIKDNTILFADLEKLLNENCNNVMSKLREQFPRIKERNLRIISLFFAGMPYELVRILVNGQSVGALKTTRSRYRKLIMDSQAKDKEQFLSLL